MSNFIVNRYIIVNNKEESILSNLLFAIVINILPSGLYYCYCYQYPASSHDEVYKLQCIQPILKICELILRDLLLDLEVIGYKGASSFTIDMNRLFENFVANLLIEKLGEGYIMLQQTEYPEVKGNFTKIQRIIKKGILSDRNEQVKKVKIWIFRESNLGSSV